MDGGRADADDEARRRADASGKDAAAAIRPLDGIRVLDLTRLLPGAFCTLMLADFGAEVVKIEQPGVGDYWREEEPRQGPFGARFAALNRNKKSVALDLKSPRGRDILLDLARGADVLAEGFRPGVMARLGLDWPALRAVNPRLIYLSLSGFGQGGPWRDVAAHDLNIVGLSGALDLSGEPDGPPAVPAVPIGDIGGGSLMALAAILLALRHRDLTGRGQALDIAVLDGLAFWLGPVAAQLDAGAPPRRGDNPILGGAAWYRAYRTADGKAMVVGAYEEKFWRRACDILGVPEFVDKLHAPPDEQRAMMRRLEAIFAGRTRAQWEAAFAGADCCVTPSLDLAEALASPQAVDRGLVRGGADGTPRHIASPLRLSEVAPVPATPPPALGADTDAVLAEAGLDEDARAALRRDGVV